MAEQQGGSFCFPFRGGSLGPWREEGEKAPFLHYCIRGNPYGFNRYAQEI